MSLEKSAGAIIFHKTRDKIEYLLLKHELGHWDFPKGHIERGESLLNTACREVEEETGLTKIVFIPEFKERITYFYKLDDTGRFKVVTFFLAETKSKKVKISREHKGYRWVRYDTATKTLEFKDQKELLKKANSCLIGIEEP